MVLFIDGEVTSQTASEFINSIQDEPLEVHIDSVGGDLFAGLKIYNALQNHSQEVDIVIDGLAGSVASVIALAGSSTSIAPTGSIMIHNALVPSMKGNHNDLRKVADTLEQYSSIVASVYADKTKLSHDEALQLMNGETTFTAIDAVELGFANSIIEPLKAVAKIDQIDMNLLESIKEKLSVSNDAEAVTAEPVAIDTPETAPAGAAFNEEQIVEIQNIVATMIAEALAGTPTTAEVGSTIATVLNSIVSEGKAPQSAGISETEAKQPEDGVSAFRSKMKEIQNKSKA
jgi:ATP-dependent protease ClpP protease subunit